MLSLDNAFADEDVVAFDRRVRERLEDVEQIEYSAEPKLDGLALFDEIRKRHPALPVILLTAHGTIPDAVEATSRGVFTYLTKPFDGKALLDKIGEALAIAAAKRI